MRAAYRVPIPVTVSLGEQEIDSGNFCAPCKAPTGETVTTEFDLVEPFRDEFDQTPVPPLTSFSFQMNTEDTRGGARAYLSKVEFLVDAED